MFSMSTLFSLALTALLCGIIMFYCKRKFAQYEYKLNTMSDLISSIITQLNQIPPSVYDNSQFYVSPTENAESQENQYNENNVSINIDEHNSTYDDETMSEVEQSDKRILVDLGNSNQVPMSMAALEEDSWDSEEEDDEENEERKIIIQPSESDFDAVINSVHLVEPSSAADEPSSATDEPSYTTTSFSETKVIEPDTSVDIDYSKMQVALLKKMVSERKLAQGVSKMKKQELVDVLMNQHQTV